MTLLIASDHGGFELKQFLLQRLCAAGQEVEDLGTDDGSVSVDYPDYAAAVAARVAGDSSVLGILVCGTGIGMSIAANKFAGVRAALAHDEFTARMAREHNNANILVLGGRVLDADAAWQMVQVWLGAAFEGGRHQNRLDKITQLEQARC